jgi:GDP-L-fucose synthase
MKLLLFGADGFIGSSLHADVRVSRRDLDLTDYQAVQTFLTRHKPTHIISAASKHGSFKEMQSGHHKYLRDNFMIDSNILEAASKCQVTNVSIISSISGLPESGEQSSEKMISMGPVADSNFGYNFSKYAATQLVKSYQMDGFENFNCLLLGNVYGYNAKFSHNTNVVATLIKRMHEAMQLNKDLELYGNGLDARCFTHLDDIGNLIEKIVKSENKLLQPIIVSESKAHTVRELADRISVSMNFKNRIKFLGIDQTSYTVKKIVNTHLMQVVGAYQFIDLAEGIDRTVKRYLDAPYGKQL